MKIDIDGPYREKRGIAQELKAYIVIAKVAAITIIILLGFHAINQLDDIMTAQRIQDKTMADCMDQIIWIRMDIDELKNTEAEIADLSNFNLTQDERTLVEQIVASESRGESVEGMAAVVMRKERSQARSDRRIRPHRGRGGKKNGNERGKNLRSYAKANG